jgi:protein involved in polysaccharide export with SLBB domain
VKVFPFYDAPRQVVTLEGNVATPGEFQFHPGMRLKDLIPGYDALLPDTYLGAVQITRLQLPDRHTEKLSANLGEALAGDPKENVELNDRDVVKVFTLWEMQQRPVVTISGQVLKPGEYRYYPNMTVRDLVAAAGSLKRNALLESAELTRIAVQDGVAAPTRRNIDLQKALAGDPASNIVLRPDDMLIVRSVTDWLEGAARFVAVKGEVKYPGRYSITKGERLSSLIARAGGFTPRAYLRGARFTRKSVQQMQQKRMEEVIERSEQDILRKQSELSAVASSSEDLAATKSSLDGMLKSLESLKKKRAEGRIVLTLLPPEELAKTEYDLELMGGDELEVPTTPSMVNVLGEVYNPTSFVYTDEDTVSSYLRKSGGPRNDGDSSEIYIVRADGTVTSREQSSFGFSWDESDKRWHFGSFMSRTLWPGDTIVVPQKLDHIAWLREIKDITTIISQVALTAGTIFLIGK